MANRVCGPVVNVPDYLVATCRVPTGQTFYPGTVVVANTVDTNISGNYSVYAATQCATPTLGEQLAIVINGGWEQLSDGRRPEGQPDYTQYSFSEGEVVTIIFLSPQMRFQISDDAVTGTPVVGQYLYPTNGSWLLTAGASVPADTYSSFKVLAEKYFRLGGNFGAQFATTFITVVQIPQ